MKEERIEVRCGREKAGEERRRGDLEARTRLEKENTDCLLGS